MASYAVLETARKGSCLKLQKKVAASIFKCGPSKVWLDPERKDEIAKARTRKDLREGIVHFGTLTGCRRGDEIAYRELTLLPL